MDMPDFGKDGRPTTATIPAPRPRIPGWSVVLAVGANLLLVVCVTVAGLSTIGLAACGSLAVMSWILIVAEALSLRRLYGRDRPGANGGERGRYR